MDEPIRTLLGVGYIGNITKEDRKYPYYKKILQVWTDMIKRCYYDKRKDGIYQKENVKVCEEWKCFKTFFDWCINTKVSNYNPKFYIDKDILGEDRKLYSPETCIFVPRRVNNVLVHVRHTSVAPGVRKQYRAYQVYITKKKEFLGGYKTLLEASAVYKVAKEHYIKYIADEALFKGEIPLHFYNIMINYKYDSSNSEASKYIQRNRKRFIDDRPYLKRFILKFKFKPQ